MATTFTVRLMVYDLSRGMAMSLSQGLGTLLGGLNLDIIPHTGLEVYDEEYFYGGGVQRCAHALVVQEYGMHPVRVEVLGRTTKTRAEFLAFLGSVSARFTPLTYDVMRNNCNHFSDAAARFLLGDAAGIPDEIVRLPERVMATPLGALVAPMFQQMNQQMQAHMIPFNAGMQAPPAASTAAPAGPAPPAHHSTVAYKMASAEHAETVVVTAPKESATAADLAAALARRTGYEASDQRVIFQGKLVQGERLLADALGPGFVAGDVVTVHVSIRPGATPAKKRTLVQALGELEASTAKAAALAAAAIATAAAAAPPDSAARLHLRALHTLQRVADNVCENPHEAKYRTVRVSNAAFSAALGRFEGGVDVLLALGFERVDDALKLEADPELWNKLALGRKIVTAARRKAARVALAPALAPPGAATPDDLVARAGLDAKDPVVAEEAAALLRRPQ